MKRETQSIGALISGGNSQLIYYHLGPKINSTKENGAYIQGRVHGGETAFWIFHKLLKHLKKVKIDKPTTLLPISNPYS
jgi:hypothetical protein